MRNYIDIVTETAVATISPQQAHDHKMFGPIYHGTMGNLDQIIQQGFDIDKSMPSADGVDHNGRPIGTSNGMAFDPFGYTGICAPIHFLGFGAYFTTVKTIAKQFAGGTMKGQRTFYLDSNRIDEINFGSPNTMMKWWLQNGYDMTAEDTKTRNMHRWIAATFKLTQTLSSRYDAVHFLGKGYRGKLLDGDQVCVYKPDLIRVVDPKLAGGLDIGAKVVHTQATPDKVRASNQLYLDDLKPDDFGTIGKLAGSGWRGVYRDDDNRTPTIGRVPIHLIPPPGMVGTIINVRKGPDGSMYDVKWQKGGTQYNYKANELRPYTKA